MCATVERPCERKGAAASLASRSAPFGSLIARRLRASIRPIWQISSQPERSGISLPSGSGQRSRLHGPRFVGSRPLTATAAPSLV